MIKKIIYKVSQIIPDKIYIKLKYYYRLKKRLNLKEPQTFNEKLQWLKLNCRRKEYSMMVDKYNVRNYIEEKIGKEYLIPLLGVYDNFDDIDFNKLPDKFVMKCTHDSGGLAICKEKSKFDFDEAKNKILKSLKRNYYYFGREWPYKNVEPKIIIEKYIQDKNSEDLMDYKMFCCNGKVKTILVCSNRKGNFKNTDFFDTKWKKQDFTREKHTNNPNTIEKPKDLEKMINIAEKLAENIPFVRVDLYNVNGQIYFGELTFFPSSGFEGFNPTEYDKILGDMIKLPK